MKIMEQNRVVSSGDGAVVFANKYELAKVIAGIVHSGQGYGEFDYEEHLRMVDEVLVEFGHGADISLRAAGALHDSVEDRQMKLRTIEKLFGEDVADLVYAVTNEIGHNRKQKFLKTIPKVRGNPRAVILKAADRIANMRYSLAVSRALGKVSDKLSMYRDEYPAFKHALCEPGQADDMWACLEHLATCEVVPAPVVASTETINSPASAEGHDTLYRGHTPF